MIQQLITIARNTFIESIRQPVFVVLILLATLALILNPALAGYTFDDDNKLMIDMGLSTLFLTGLLLAAFTATGVLSTEIENRTALTVVSKPVARPVFVLGKYVGVVTAIGMAYWVLTMVFLLTVRHRVMQTASDPFDEPVLTFGCLAGLLALVGSTLANYFYRWVFTSTFAGSLTVLLTIAWGLVLMIGKGWQFQSPLVDLSPQLILVLLLVFEGVLVLTAVAIAASTRLGQVMTLVVSAVVFLIGLISNAVFGQLADESLLARVLYRLTLNLQLLWQADALTQGHDISGVYFTASAGYTVLYIAAILSLAIALFQKREVG